MPDISMCANHKCPLARKCYRMMATPSKYQSMMDFKPNKDGTCDNFMKLRNVHQATKQDQN